METESQSYAVVEFVDENAVEVVVKKWIETQNGVCSNGNLIIVYYKDTPFTMFVNIVYNPNLYADACAMPKIIFTRAIIQP
jgi:hypothetical protein